MEQIARYLQADPPLLGPALARLCQLARAQLGHWDLHADALPHAACLERLQRGAPPTAAELAESPRAWLGAIDEELSTLTAPGARRPETPVFDCDDAHWIIRRSHLPAGYNARPGALSHHLAYHHVLPARIVDIPTRAAAVPHATAAACQSMLDKGRFTFAVVRFDDGVAEELVRFPAITHFRMGGLDKPDLRLASAIDALQAARDAKADCLVFPELTFTPALARAFAEQLLDAALAHTANLPPLIVLGSYHQATGDDDQPPTRNPQPQPAPSPRRL